MDQRLGRGTGAFILALFLLTWAADILPELAGDGSPKHRSGLSHPAVNAAERFAWRLFLEINRPADVDHSVRGLPHPVKKIGEPGCVVWETWAAADEVFLDYAARPPEWNDLSQFPLCRKKLQLPKRALLLQDVFQRRGMKLPEVLQRPSEETRMNEATYTFIREKGLYDLDVQVKLYNDAAKDPNVRVDFPLDSIEVKAAWVDFRTAKSLDPKDYHKSNDGLYGLQAMHITTKDLPNWFWATFVHKDKADSDSGTSGMPEELKGTKWWNYRLVGAQVEFTNSIGQPKILSNPVIEESFRHSSCMSCHARATIGPGAVAGGDRLPMNCDSSMPGPPVCPIGTPNPSEFVDEKEQLRYLQLDFVWSLRRAQRKESKQTPPAPAASSPH